VRLDVTEAVWLVTGRYFRQLATAKRETVALWYGIEQPNRHLAVAVGFPQAGANHFNFAILPDELQALSEQAVPAGLMVVAQLHAHPGRSTTHSNHDDENAVSFHPGFVSIVLPHYGHAGLDDVVSLGIHERDGTAWRKLAPKDNARRVRVLPTVFDA
jgi:proteasome lid subunit RPN8/RPN11